MLRRGTGLALALLALSALPLRAQTAAESAAREVQTAQDQLARAVTEFEGANQSRSVVLLDEVINRLDNVRRQGLLTSQGRDLLAQAYELRGRAYFNIGLQEKASENFRILIQLKPDYTITKEKVSPKIVDLFNSVKKLLVGYLAVSSKPAGAKVTRTSGTGEVVEMGLTDFFPLDVLAGDYTVQISKEGYQTETRQVSIAARDTQSLQVDLVRTLASAFFITEPTGVEIWIDGELKTTTGGTLAPDLYERARSRGLDPARASGRVEVGNLSLTTHTVEFRKKCYDTARRALDTSQAQDYDFDPVHLDDSLASLRLVSDPPGAKIFLNSEARGVTPAELTGICSGKVRVEVKHAAGKFIKDLVLGKDEAVSLDCPIRPTLAFLGVVPETAAGERYLADADEKIRENLATKITSLNFVPAPRETVDRILEQEKLTRKALVPGAGADLDVIRKVTEKMADALDQVQGFLIAVLPEERLQRTAVLHLLAAGNVKAEPWPVTFGEAASYVPFVARVDQKVTSYRPWSGLITVDTQLYADGIPVLRVVAGSPAAQAGVLPGELITAADGKPVVKTADLLAAVASKKAKDSLALHVKGGAGPRTVELTLAQTPQEIPLFDPALLYNKVMMDLRGQVEGYPGTEQAAFAWLNLALAAMHFEEYATAHDYLLKAKAELPTRPGVSQGTALYYLGLALEKLNYKSQAVDAYRAAAGFKDATLINNDGPAVAPLASRRAGP